MNDERLIFFAWTVSMLFWILSCHILYIHPIKQVYTALSINDIKIYQLYKNGVKTLKDINDYSKRY